MSRVTDEQINEMIPVSNTNTDADRVTRPNMRVLLKGIRDMADTIDWDIPANQTVQPLAELSEYVFPPEFEIPVDQIISGLTVTNNGGAALTVKAGDGLPETGIQWLAWDMSDVGSETELLAGVIANTFDEAGVFAQISGGNISIALDGDTVPGESTEITHDILFTEWNADLKTFRVVANDGAFDETVDASSSTSLDVMAALCLGGNSLTATVDPLQLGNITPSVGSTPWSAVSANIPDEAQDDQWLRVTVAGSYGGINYEVGERVRVLDATAGTVEPLKTRADLTLIEQSVGTLEQSVGTLEQSVGTLEQSVGTLEQSVGELEQSVGEPNGIAPLDGTGKLPVVILPDGLARVVNKAVGTPEIGSPVEVAMPGLHGNGHWLGIRYDGTNYEMYKRNQYFSNPQPLTLIGGNGATTESIGSSDGSDGTHLIATNPGMDFYSGFFSDNRGRVWRLSVIRQSSNLWELIAELM